MAGNTFWEYLFYIDLFVTGFLGGIMLCLVVVSKVERWING